MMDDNSALPQTVTNLSYLSELSKGDPQFVDEMIKLFLQENPREIKMLEDGIKEKNLYAINLAAHKLRSTLPFIGIEKFIEKEVEEIETIAINNAVVQKIEITPEDDHDLKKIEIVTTDTKVIQKIEELFPKVKTFCEKAREELKS